MVLGVCSSLSNDINMDTKLMRILFIISTFIFGAGIAVYLILWAVKFITK